MRAYQKAEWARLRERMLTGAVVFPEEKPSAPPPAPTSDAALAFGYMLRAGWRSPSEIRELEAQPAIIGVDYSTDHDGGYLVPADIAATVIISIRAADEGWDRRRLKRELRKGANSTYSKKRGKR